MKSIEARAYRHFLLLSGLIIALFLSAIFLGLAIQTRRLMNEQIQARARSLVESVILARRWNSGYHGVYVEKKDGMQSNPYLENPDIVTGDGKVYTKKNPALMLREISEISNDSNFFTFRITSAKPINPINSPNAFEKQGLTAIDTGSDSFKAVLPGAEGVYFHYLVPLYTEQSCLACHAKQGYKVGDVRGAVSVAFNITEAETALRRNFIIIGVLSVLCTGFLLGLLYVAFRILKKRLEMAKATLEAMASLDSLTGINNRKHFLERFDEEFARAKRKGVLVAGLMMDIDHFKTINDELGHAAGDSVLREFAGIVQESIRPYDIFGRIGGEEFFLVLPETSSECAYAIAERIRHAIHRELAQRASLDAGRTVTISLGLTVTVPDDTTIEVVMARADAALYAAKHQGRNQTVLSEGFGTL